MIGIITGTADSDGVVMTAGGVGYEVLTLDKLTEGAEVKLYTHAVYREDAATLYGFSDPSTRAAFRELLKAPGVGPTLAMNMLARWGAGGIKRIFRDKDAAALKDLTQVDGIGPKSAQKLLATVSLSTEGAEETPRSEAVRKAQVALIGLGFREADVETVLGRIEDTGDVGEMIKESLAVLRPGEKVNA